MWLRREMAKRDMQQPPAPSPIENNPVGWSSIYSPQVATNASPDFSPLANPAYMTSEQAIGGLWDLATRRGKPWTNRDLPALAESGRNFYDNAAGFVGMGAPTGRANGTAINEALAAKFPDVQFYVSAPRSGERLVLDKIVVPAEMRNQGVGSAFMQELARLADEAGVPVGLTPSNHFGGSVAKLRDFYQRFGFAPNTGRARDLTITDAMVRNPK